jgi:hypothetical protein
MKARPSRLLALAFSAVVLWSAPASAQTDAPPPRSTTATEPVVVNPVLPTEPAPPGASVVPAPPPSGALVPDAISGPGVAALEPVLAAPRAVYKRRYNMALFGGALLLATFTADRLLMGDLSKSGVAWVPLVGPWFLLDLQLRQPVPNAATLVFLAIDGVLQAGGLTMTVLGLVLRERRLTVRLAAPTPSTSPNPAAPSAP